MPTLPIELRAIRAESLHDSVLTGTAPEEWEPVVAVSAASSESGVTGAVNASTARKPSDGTFLFRPWPTPRKVCSSENKLCSTHSTAYTLNSALELTCSLCLIFSRWLSTVFTLKLNNSAMFRVPSPEPVSYTHLRAH